MDILIRSVVVFFVMWVVLRLGGKREVAQLSAFDLILLVTLGDLVSQGILQEDYSLTAVVIAVSTIALASMLLGVVGLRFPRARNVLGGTPRIVVRDGEPLVDVMRAELFTLDDLCESARQQGIRDLADIELSVLEADGTFSFFTRGGDQGGEDPAGNDATDAKKEI
jgi:uncharacterized membrane protein YcaP (DUF421 family)